MTSPRCARTRTYLRDLEARQLADLRAREAVHGVCADFERQLPTVEHLLLERVSLLLQLFLRAVVTSTAMLLTARSTTGRYTTLTNYTLRT